LDERPDETRSGCELLANGLSCRTARVFQVDGAILTRLT
jgi:hypothetical protein